MQDEGSLRVDLVQRHHEDGGKLCGDAVLDDGEGFIGGVCLFESLSERNGRGVGRVLCEVCSEGTSEVGEGGVGKPKRRPGIWLDLQARDALIVVPGGHLPPDGRRKECVEFCFRSSPRRRTIL